MSKPIVAVVGRPNVGKSTFLIVLPDSRYLSLRIHQVLQEIEYMPKYHGLIKNLP